MDGVEQRLVEEGCVVLCRVVYMDGLISPGLHAVKEVWLKMEDGKGTGGCGKGVMEEEMIM